MIVFTTNQFNDICQIINKGKVIAVPTDTVFALVCKFNDDKAIHNVYKIKKREFNKTLPILVGSWKQATTIGIINEELKNFLITNFPKGKVTVIVLKKLILNTPYWNNQKTVAIRVSDSLFIKKLTKEVGPLVATSCNLSGEVPIADSANIALEHLEYKVDGQIKINQPSIIYDSLQRKIIRE